MQSSIVHNFSLFCAVFNELQVLKWLRLMAKSDDSINAILSLHNTRVYH